MPVRTAQSEAHVAARLLASRVLLELDLLGVVQSPEMFSLFHAYFSGRNPKLVELIQLLLRENAQPSQAALDALYAKHAGRLSETYDNADALRQEAQSIVEDVAEGGASLRRYGNVLTVVASELFGNRSVENLAHALDTLAAETARASERNRELEHQLAATTARVTRLRDTLSDVKREACTDALTGLCNRKAFDARLRRALSTQKSDGVVVSVLLIDVDHFKQVNDTYGHQVGDLVLRLISRLLTESVKGRDTAARHGGEEFAIILAGAGSRAASIVAEQLRSMLASTRFGGKGVSAQASVTISIGVAEGRSGDTITSLMSRADMALYRAKEAGRNRVCVDGAVTA